MDSEVRISRFLSPIQNFASYFGYGENVGQVFVFLRMFPKNEHLYDSAGTNIHENDDLGSNRCLFGPFLNASEENETNNQ